MSNITSEYYLTQMPIVLAEDSPYHYEMETVAVLKIKAGKHEFWVRPIGRKVNLPGGESQICIILYLNDFRVTHQEMCDLLKDHIEYGDIMRLDGSAPEPLLKSSSWWDFGFDEAEKIERIEELTVGEWNEWVEVCASY